MNRTNYAKIDDKEGCLCERHNSTEFGLMASCYTSYIPREIIEPIFPLP
jgi:hypothetical protein